MSTVILLKSADFQPPTNPYPGMTLAAFAAEFPEIPETWKLFSFFAGLSDGKPANAVLALINAGLPHVAERIKHHILPITYRQFLRVGTRELPCLKYVLEYYPEIITDADAPRILGNVNADYAKVYVSAFPDRKWTAEELALLADRLGCERAACLAENNLDAVVDLFKKCGRPELACKILSRFSPSTAVKTLMKCMEACAHIYFDALTPECFNDSRLYVEAVRYCGHGTPYVIAGLFHRGVPATMSIVKDSEFSPFKQYLIACM